MVYSSRQDLCAHNKNIRGNGVSFSDSPGRLEEFSFTSIYNNENDRDRNTKHNKISHFGKEVEELKVLPNESPFYPIKGLIKINFEYHIGLLASHL